MNAASVEGVWVVARQEFRIKLRTGRWRWLLIGWVVLLAAFTLLSSLALKASYGFGGSRQQGIAVFGIIMLFVLGMVLVISPALTAQAINGDRERGTLATLQVTALRPMEIALGKLVAGWGVGLAALALTLPFTGYAAVMGQLSPLRVLAVYVVVALLSGVVCATSLALSALLARTITSTLLSYLLVAGLAVGTAIAFALSLPLVSQSRATRFPDGSEARYSEQHQEYIWWLLAPNPFVVVADAAPPVQPRDGRDDNDVYASDFDVLTMIGQGVRELRMPSDDIYRQDQPGSNRWADVPVWPYGLGFNVLLGVGAVAITAKRLRAPSDKLPQAVRIA